MSPRKFRDVAARMFDEIPAEYREGIVGLIVEDGAPEHPGLPGIWTMGECLTEEWPDGTGGLTDTQSQILLHYGSFRNLAEQDPMFDWEAELWETIIHELLHHREAAAAESGLDEFDWAVDQNFQRHAGLPFDPDFYRAVAADEDGAVRIEGETFVETTTATGQRRVRFEWRGDTYSLDVPSDVNFAFVSVRNLAAGRLWVVVRRHVSWWRRWLGADNVGFPVHLERRALPELVT